MKPRWMILAASLLWSTAGAAIKLSPLDGWQINAGRSLVAAAFLALVFREGRRLPGLRTLGVSLAYAGTVLLFVLANKITTAANVILLQSSAPLYVLALSPWLIGEKPSGRTLLAVPLAMAGLVLLFSDQLSGGGLLGNTMAAASGVTFALVILGLRKLQEGAAGSDSGTAITAVVWGNLIAGLGSLPLAVNGPGLGVGDLAMLLYLGCVQLGLAYALFTRGVKGTPAVEASLLVLAEPVLNPTWAYLLVGERPGSKALVGGAILLAATTWQAVEPALARRRAQAPALPAGSA